MPDLGKEAGGLRGWLRTSEMVTRRAPNGKDEAEVKQEIERHRWNLSVC